MILVKIIHSLITVYENLKIIQSELTLYDFKKSYTVSTTDHCVLIDKFAISDRKFVYLYENANLRSVIENLQSYTVII